MKTLFRLLAGAVLTVLCGSDSSGQIRPGTPADQYRSKSREEARAWDEYASRMNILPPGPVPQFPIWLSTQTLNAKVYEVMDANKILLGIEDARVSSGRYDTLVVLKCDEEVIKTLKAGQTWRGGQWQSVLGHAMLGIFGTTKYVQKNKNVIIVLEGQPPKMSVNRPPAPAVVEKPAVRDKPAAPKDHVEHLRDAVLAAAKEAKEMMKREGLDEADIAYVNEYVNRFQGRVPTLKGVNERTRKVLLSEEVIKWVNAEVAYVTARDKKRK